MPPVNLHHDDNRFLESDEGQPVALTEAPVPVLAQHSTPPESEPDVFFSKTRKSTKKSKKIKKKVALPLEEPCPPPEEEDEGTTHIALPVPSCEPDLDSGPEDGPEMETDDVRPELDAYHEPDSAWLEPADLVDLEELPHISTTKDTQQPAHGQEDDLLGYEDRRSTAVTQRPTSTKQTTYSASPPARSAAPALPSRRANNLSDLGRLHQQTQAQHLRRESFVHSQAISPRQNHMNPPLPHLPQQHFYQLPDLGFNLGQQKELGKAAGSDGCCCCFDTFADAGDTTSGRKAKDALLVGFEGGIDVYRVISDKLEVVGRLEGLRGLVVGAKVLPSSQKDDPLATQRPLIALIVHGPMADDRADSGQDDDGMQEPASHYQTTVEVYALQDQKHIATLYKSLPIKRNAPVAGHLTLPPRPIGDLAVDSASTFIIVTSGKSGEVYVFSNTYLPAINEPCYRLVGKFWTALQDQGTNEPTPNPANTERSSGIPLVSLSHRWLAFVPPYTSASHTISGLPLLSASSPTPPGLSSLSAPVQPHVSCEVAGVDAEGMLSWLSRTAAQGLVKASQKGYEISLQGWKELTNPSHPNNKDHLSSTEQNLFPPTNAPADDPRRLAKEPALVSLIDLQRLLHYETDRPKQLPGPFATFALVEGCNYLSFSPDGLRLLTTSRKGEASTVWDLEHIAHGSTRKALDEDVGMELKPHVKQVHRIVRSSPSLVIDTVWSRDGDWLAIVTTHGTVHLHQIATSGVSRKRKRRNTITAPVLDKAEATVGVSQGMSPPSNGLWGRFSSGLQSVGVQVNAIRTQGSIQTTFAGFREATGTLKTAGGRAIAKGFNQGINAAKDGASDIWHAEDNKIRHKGLQDPVTRTACVRWIQRGTDTSLAVVCAGSVHIHGVSPVLRRKGEIDVAGLKQDKRGRKSFALPRISAGRESSNIASLKPCTAAGPHGFWSLRHTISPEGKAYAGQQQVPPVNVPLSTQATEVETNPPYCPFHIDPRVSIFAYEESTADAAAILDAFLFRGHGLNTDGEDADAWLFGETLPTSVKINDTPLSDLEGFDPAVSKKSGSDDESDTDTFAGQVESRLTVHNISLDEGNTSQEIRVATRRTRRGADEPGAAEFVMLEDDDE